MSAHSEVLRAAELLGRGIEVSAKESQTQPNSRGWNPEAFAREQIRTLVRRVFLNSSAKQVVFCAAASSPDVAHVCEQVGESLARETCSEVAVVVEGGEERNVGFSPDHGEDSIRALGKQMGANLWRLPSQVIFRNGENSERNGCWLSSMAKLRSEFEYSVIQGPAAGVSSDAEFLGQLADGLILVLGAHSAHRASVRKVKESLDAGRTRILGSVLSGRLFPIPEGIYRRL